MLNGKHGGRFERARAHQSYHWGGGGGGNTTQTQKFEPPDYTKQGWKDYLSNVTNLAPGIAGAQYTGPTVAGQTTQSMTAGDMASSLAQNGSPLTNVAYQQFANTAAGNNSNPYATMGNAYMGDNPYFQSVINKTNNDITNQYRTGTAAQTDASAARGGAFGGSAYNQTVQNNQTALANSLAQNEDALRMQNYNQSAGLADNQLNRATSAYDAERNRQLQAAGAAPAMQSSDLEAINAMNQYGNQTQTQMQAQLDAAKNAWNSANQAPLTAQDIIRNALSAASGTGGQSSSQILGQSSPWQTAAGVGSLIGSLGSAFGG